MHGTVSFAFVEVVVDFTDLAFLCYLLITLKEKKHWDFSSVIIIINLIINFTRNMTSTS